METELGLSQVAAALTGLYTKIVSNPAERRRFIGNLSFSV
jgi:hypothetical protein